MLFEYVLCGVLDVGVDVFEFCEGEEVGCVVCVVEYV